MNSTERGALSEKRLQTSDILPNGTATPAWLLALADEVDELALHIKRYGREDAPDIARRMRSLADILEQRI